MTVGELITELAKYKMDDDVCISIDDKTKIGKITNTTYFKGMCEIHFNNWTNPIQIPEGATNGQMIRTMFPNAKIVRGYKEYILVTFSGNISMSFNMVWWNSPYREEQE